MPGNARIVIPKPSRIILMLFVPMRGDTHRGKPFYYYGHESKLSINLATLIVL